jgi:streptomycin 6-kinase
VREAALERWQLVSDGTFPHNYSHVEPVRRSDGSEAVLRITPSSLDLDAAEWFGGHGAPRVLEIDRSLGAVLLERVRPGTTLVDEPEDAVVGAACDVMRALWRAPSGCAFPSVRDWGRSLAAGTRAAGVFAELCDSMADPVVLHGDLHHENVLRADDGWLAIDAKGVVGEPAYELGALLRNPKPQLLASSDVTGLLRRRAEALCEALGFDVSRVLGWAFAQAELSAAWSVEDGEDPAYALAVAERLAPLTRGR